MNFFESEKKDYGTVTSLFRAQNNNKHSINYFFYRVKTEIKISGQLADKIRLDLNVLFKVLMNSSLTE